ncbi:hypothetical protein [Streptomyces sp. MI02-7b]|uniref:hypothetical protein n=1 Tax=Streptomyces sp. MI02-7b TaxID=462941 RepID=UPI0029A7BB19|nr:hypothetical protein [Streptomyces sp. MI02-7b]MDX3071750.1 hypothetical protein [Streptomyces sp. MI02-7b]
MTPDPEQEDRLRAAFARSRDAYPSSRPPVERILTFARTRRRRRRAAAAATAGAACVLTAALTLPFLGSHPSAGPAHTGSPSASPTATGTARTPDTVTVRVAEGTTDGQPWSVALEFHRTLPEGYTRLVLPDGSTTPGDALLCQRMYIGGVRIDHQGGPWSDCQPVTGTDDPQAGGNTGLWGLHDKGTTGTRLIVSHPGPEVAYGVLHLSDGSQVKAFVITLPGTGYRAWAAPVPGGRTITSVDEYDAGDRRLGHYTDWR